MTNNKWRLLVIALPVCAIIGTQAVSQNSTNVDSYLASRIMAMNNVVPPHESSNAENALNDEHKEIVSKIKEELAQHGITVRLVNAEYIDVSERVANGYVLNSEDKIRIAVLNYLQDAYCTNLKPDQLVSGEVQASMNVIKREMADHGISVQLEDGLFVVRSAKEILGVVP